MRRLISRVFLGAVVAASVFYKRGMRESQEFRLKVDQLKLRMPVFGQLFRGIIGDVLGQDIHLWDRSAGFALGATRALLVAVLLVLVFDRIITAGRDPEFLKDSKLRPALSLAAQRGLRSLPPEIEEYIDQLKRERGL